MKTLVIKIINTLFPYEGSHYKFDWSVQESHIPMIETLLKLDDTEIIRLYDKIVHGQRSK